MKVIAFCNHKGGCGKTTSSVNVAARLALDGKRVLLLDLDPQGAATLGLGIDKTSLKYDLTNVMLDNVPLASVIVQTNGLDIAPCKLDLIAADPVLAAQAGKEFILKEKLADLKGYDYVIMDTPPNLGVLTVNALVACSDVIIPIQCEYYAMEGVRQLNQILELVNKRLGNVPRVRVVMTMYSRTNLCHDVQKAVQEHFGDRVFKTIIPKNIKLAEAPAVGKSIFLHAPESSGAEAYTALVAEMIQNG